MEQPGGCFLNRKRETLSESTILLCGPALNAAESAASLEKLRALNLPGGAKFLVTTGKFDTEGVAKGVNVEADYPSEPPFLQTLLTWSDAGGLPDPRFRDGYDLYCLRRVLARFQPFEFAVLLRQDAGNLEERWPELRKSVDGHLFLTFGNQSSPSLLVDLKDARATAFLESAWQLYITGAIYGLDDYAFDRALGLALTAVEPQTSSRNFTRGTDEIDRSGDFAEASLAGDRGI